METDKWEMKIKAFNGNRGEDFRLWAMRVMACLEGKDLSDVVKGESVRPDERIDDEVNPEFEKYIKRCKKARALIVTLLGDKPLRAIRSAVTPKEVWEKLHEKYAGVTNTDNISVLTTLINKKFHNGKDMGDHIAEMESLFSYLASMGSNLDDQMQVALSLVSLSAVEELRGVCAAVKTLDSTRTTWNEVSTRLIEEHNVMRQMTTESHNLKRKLAAVRKSDPRKRRFKCYNCGKSGHIAKYCKNKPSSKEDKRGDGDNESNAQEVSFRIASAIVNKESSHYFRAAVDSGASHHVVSSMKVLYNIERMPPVEIELADGRKVIACEKGEVELIPSSEGNEIATNIVLKEVYYVPYLDMSLISCARLDKAGISCCFSDGVCKFLDRNDDIQLLGVGVQRKCDGLYEVGMKLQESASKAMALKTEKVQQPQEGLELWHMRLGHCAKATVRRMATGVLLGMSLDDKPKKADCTMCLESKQCKDSCNGNLIKNGTGHAIHSDIVGPMSVESKGKSRYFVIFVVENSRYAKVFPLRARSEAKETLMQFISWLERQSGWKGNLERVLRGFTAITLWNI